MSGVCVLRTGDRWQRWIILCLLVKSADLPSVQSVPVDQSLEDVPVMGVLNQPVTLDCPFPVPTNWNLSEIHVIWFRNFTERLEDCMVEKGRAPTCQESSPRTRLSGDPFKGNAALDILQLQESDLGNYQCWVIFPEAYIRVDKELSVQGEDPMKRGDVAVGIPLRFGEVFLMSGCAALLLCMRFWGRRSLRKARNAGSTSPV